MEQRELEDLYIRMKTLVVFRSLLDNPVVADLVTALGFASQCVEGTQLDLAESYARFVSGLFARGFSGLAPYVREVVLDDENVFLRRVGAKEKVSALLGEATASELETLEKLACLTPEDLTATLPESVRAGLAIFDAQHLELVATYRERLSHIHQFGYGMYARYHVFRMDDSGHIVAVRHPDPINLGELVDYDREKKIILDNTRALLHGKPAANILLTGDAGTGKSSTVKAVANELADQGLRILEVHKEQLTMIPALLDELTKNPLCFIIFIDDLSFARDDDNFAALKAILEGSVSAKSSNVVIYATSNRRHLVKETFSEREQEDDVHLNDTMQEIVSLSDRFGIHLTFSKPSKEVYLDIVHKLAKVAGIRMDQKELDQAAERFALRKGGRSARGARQLVDGLASAEYGGEAYEESMNEYKHLTT